MAWTEIMGESVGVSHVEGMNVVFPIGEPSDGEMLRAKCELETRLALQHQREQFRALARDIERKEEARDVLREAGYEDHQIPL